VLLKKTNTNLPASGTQPTTKSVAEAKANTTTSAILTAAPGPGQNLPLGHIPPQWAKHYRRLLSLRARLEAERREQALAACQPLENYSMDMADAATDEFDHDVVLCLLSAEQDALYEIDAALKRIAAGTYGVCELSGKRIPKARLHALPWTRFAEDVERQLELKGALHPLKLGQLGSVLGPRVETLGEAEREQEAAEAPPCDETLPLVTPKPTVDLAVEPMQPVKRARSAKPRCRGSAKQYNQGRSRRRSGRRMKGEKYVPVRSLRKRL
jgi:RNA polymerase-binding transcription factor DksA